MFSSKQLTGQHKRFQPTFLAHYGITPIFFFSSTFFFVHWFCVRVILVMHTRVLLFFVVVTDVSIKTLVVRISCIQFIVLLFYCVIRQVSLLNQSDYDSIDPSFDCKSPNRNSLIKLTSSTHIRVTPKAHVWRTPFTAYRSI